MVFGGFVLTFTPQFLLGNAGMPRRYYYYPPELQPLHVISTLGALVLGSGLLLVVGYLAVALFGKRAPTDNPWSSRCFEWRTPSPPPRDNFDVEPSYRVGAYDYSVSADELARPERAVVKGVVKEVVREVQP
jgi:cytochrome c oxidase subunit 1